MPDRIVHIVDDDEAVRQSLAFLLGSAGLTVRLYDSATAFLAGLSGVKSGCIVTDVRMPDMTGIELLQQLRSRACNLPAIVITGHGDVPLAVEAMKAGTCWWGAIGTRAAPRPRPRHPARQHVRP